MSAAMVLSSSDRSEIAFFDVETSVPARRGQGFALLEFGAILVCPRKLIELYSYSTLVKPSDLNQISNLSVRCNGITRDAVVSAPSFAEIADKVYDILHGRIWAGHNILRFDCARIREAYTEINRPPPEPRGAIDSLALLTQRFGRRAGNMKMASLATYFGLGEQTHRSLDDVRMNLEVLKYCATVLFLESSLPDILIENSWVSPNATTRSRSNGRLGPEERSTVPDRSSSTAKAEICSTASPVNHTDEPHPIFSLLTPMTSINTPEQAVPNTPGPDPFDMVLLTSGVEREPPVMEDIMEEGESGSESRESHMVTASQGNNGHVDFLEPHEVYIPSISVSLAPFYRGTQKIQILHKRTALQVFGRQLKVRFGISTKYLDSNGRPRLSFVVGASPNLCEMLDNIDQLAQKLSVDSGSNSEWRPSVTRKPGFFNYPTLRLHLPTIFDGTTHRWATEIYHQESSTTQKLVFSRFDVAELDSLLAPGRTLDACFSINTYDFQQNAGIRLVANKLIILPN